MELECIACSSTGKKIMVLYQSVVLWLILSLPFFVGIKNWASSRTGNQMLQFTWVIPLWFDPFLSSMLACISYFLLHLQFISLPFRMPQMEWAESSIPQGHWIQLTCLAVKKRICFDNNISTHIPHTNPLLLGRHITVEMLVSLLDPILSQHPLRSGSFPFTCNFLYFGRGMGRCVMGGFCPWQRLAAGPSWTGPLPHLIMPICS